MSPYNSPPTPYFEPSNSHILSESEKSCYENTIKNMDEEIYGLRQRTTMNDREETAINALVQKGWTVKKTSLSYPPSYKVKRKKKTRARNVFCFLSHPCNHCKKYFTVTESSLAVKCKNCHFTP